MTKTTESRKDKKSAQKDKLVMLQSSIGYEKLLYPFSSHKHTERHPYTREVLGLGEAYGFTQSIMAEMAGVSQSQISQWLDGQSKATCEQLDSITHCLLTKAPGDSFYLLEGVTKSWIELPEDWELKMFQLYISRNLNTAVESKEGVDEIFKASFLEETREKIKLITVDCENKEREIRNLINSAHNIERMILVTKDRYDESVNERKAQRLQYIQDNPQVKSMAEKDLKEFLDKTIEAPRREEYFADVKNGVDVLRVDCKDLGINIPSDGDENETDQIEVIVGALKDLSEITAESFLVEKNSILKKGEEIVGGLSIFDQCTINDLDRVFLLDCDTRESGEFIDEKSRGYFNDNVFSYVNRGYVCSEHISKIFSQYIKTLKTFDENQDVQICGEKLVDGDFLQAEALELREIKDHLISQYKSGSDNIECYRLVHGDLVVRWMLGDDYSRNKKYYIRRFDEPNSFLSWIERILTLSEISDYKGRYEYYRKSLVEAGYRISGVESYF